MSETRHSPEPWAWDPEAGGTVFMDRNGNWVCPSERNWRRIVAAVNAVAGIPTEALEAGELANLLTAADGAVYCVMCWDNPDHNLCPKHLDPFLSALRALGRLAP